MLTRVQGLNLDPAVKRRTFFGEGSKSVLEDSWVAEGGAKKYPKERSPAITTAVALLAAPVITHQTPSSVDVTQGFQTIRLQAFLEVWGVCANWGLGVLVSGVLGSWGFGVLGLIFTSGLAELEGLGPRVGKP